MSWSNPTWTAIVVTVSMMNQIRDNFTILKAWIGDDGYPRYATTLTKSATYTLTTTDPMLTYVTGTFTLSLPASPITGKPYRVKKTDSTGLVTVAGNTHNIDGVTTFVLGPYDAFTFHYNGTEWNVT